MACIKSIRPFPSSYFTYQQVYRNIPIHSIHTCRPPSYNQIHKKCKIFSNEYFKDFIRRFIRIQGIYTSHPCHRQFKGLLYTKKDLANLAYKPNGIWAHTTEGSHHEQDTAHASWSASGVVVWQLPLNSYLKSVTRCIGSITESAELQRRNDVDIHSSWTTTIPVGSRTSAGCRGELGFSPSASWQKRQHLIR